MFLIHTYPVTRHQGEMFIKALINSGHNIELSFQKLNPPSAASKAKKTPTFFLHIINIRKLLVSATSLLMAAAPLSFLTLPRRARTDEKERKRARRGNCNFATVPRGTHVASYIAAIRALCNPRNGRVRARSFGDRNNVRARAAVGKL